MKKTIFTGLALLTGSLAVAQTNGTVNDNNTPLHLMKPAYRVG